MQHQDYRSVALVTTRKLTTFSAILSFIRFFLKSLPKIMTDTSNAAGPGIHYLQSHIRLDVASKSLDQNVFVCVVIESKTYHIYKLVF
jgi:hypothetical protein